MSSRVSSLQGMFPAATDTCSGWEPTAKQRTHPRCYDRCSRYSGPCTQFAATTTKSRNQDNRVGNEHAPTTKLGRERRDVSVIIEGHDGDSESIRRVARHVSVASRTRGEKPERWESGRWRIR